MVGLLIVGVVVLAAVVAYKLWKSGKAVTGAAVVAGVEADVTAAAKAAEAKIVTAVANTVVSKL
jgi:hypothetical protein